LVRPSGPGSLEESAKEATRVLLDDGHLPRLQLDTPIGTAPSAHRLDRDTADLCDLCIKNAVLGQC
jgi:hypothetical protein